MLAAARTLAAKKISSILQQVNSAALTAIIVAAAPGKHMGSQLGVHSRVYGQSSSEEVEHHAQGRQCWYRQEHA